jgi:hypothetical protein
MKITASYNGVVLMGNNSNSISTSSSSKWSDQKFSTKSIRWMQHFNNVIATANIVRNIGALVASQYSNIFAIIKIEKIYKTKSYLADINVPVFDEAAGNKYTSSLFKFMTSFTAPESVTVVPSSTPTTVNWAFKVV